MNLWRDYSVDVFNCSDPMDKREFLERIRFLQGNIKTACEMMADMGLDIYFETNVIHGLDSVCAKLGEWELDFNVRAGLFQAYCHGMPLIDEPQEIDPESDHVTPPEYNPREYNYEVPMKTIMEWIYETYRGIEAVEKLAEAEKKKIQQQKDGGKNA